MSCVHVLLAWLSIYLQPRTARRVRKAAVLTGLRHEERRGYWIAFDESNHRFRKNLYLRPTKDRVKITVSSDVFADRPWLHHELLLLLLEENHLDRSAAFGLVDTRWGHTVTLTQWIDGRDATARAIAKAGNELLERMQKSLDRWYAAELIEAGRTYLSLGG